MESNSIIQKRLELYCIQEINNFLEKDRLSDNLDVVMKSVGQSLFWSMSLLEFYQKNYEFKYKEFHDQHADRKVIVGLRFVRNRITHQFCEVVYQRSVGTFPMTFPKAFYDIAWKSVEELPPFDPKYKNSQKHSKDCYEEKLQNNSLRYTLEVLKAFVSEFSEQVRLESV